MSEHAASMPERRPPPVPRRAPRAQDRSDAAVGLALRPSPVVLLSLQRAVGNQAVVQLTDGSATLPAAPGRVVQRLALQEGPPLAPGNYRYGPEILSLDPADLRKTLSDKAGREGLGPERTWEQNFAADMRAQSGKPRSYEDPASKQTIAVEPAFASRADTAQQQLDTQATAVQTQFQQQLLVSVGTLLDTSEKKLEAEGRRYGFPDTESIFKPKPVSAGQAALQLSMPGAEDLRGVMRGAKDLQAGKQKVKKARETLAKAGPILGDAMRPTVLEPALHEYHDLRQKVCTQYPILASVERDETRLAELASGAGAPATGPAAAAALQKARDEVRKELADKLGNIAFVRDGMKAQDKIDRFWLDSSLRANTKRGLSIAPATFQNAAVEEKVARLQEDAEFEQKLKQALGVGLLIASFIPGVGPVAGAVGLAMGAADVVTAFQQYYWEQAAAGTAMEKAEAISQTDPSLFSLAFSIATGLLEGVAEAKALEGAIGVFKAVTTAYREARAAAVAAEIGSGAAKASATAEFVTASQKLKTTANEAAGSPTLGDRILTDLVPDARTTARSLDASLRTITDPTLRQMVRDARKAVTPSGKTLMDLAIEDPHGLQEAYAEWSRTSRSGSSGRSFEDWLRDVKQGAQHRILNNPAGIIEEGLDAAGGRRSFDACLREDPSREAGVWRDPDTGEHVCVQGGAGYVEGGWMNDPEMLRGGRRPRWEFVVHHHPSRGMAIDRLPSQADFNVITSNQRRPGATPQAVQSSITWIDPVSKIRFTTEYGFTPGAPRPYWTRYRLDDGTYRVASFRDPPFGAGNAEYQQWLNTFTATPAEPVPGGGLPPVTPPPRTP